MAQHSHNQSFLSDGWMTTHRVLLLEGELNWKTGYVPWANLPPSVGQALGCGDSTGMGIWALLHSSNNSSFFFFFNTVYPRNYGKLSMWVIFDHLCANHNKMMMVLLIPSLCKWEYWSLGRINHVSKIIWMESGESKVEIRLFNPNQPAWPPPQWCYSTSLTIRDFVSVGDDDNRDRIQNALCRSCHWVEFSKGS